MEDYTCRHQLSSRSFLAAAALALSVAVASVALAHGNEDHAAKGPHGGILRTVDAHHLELLVKNGQARVWVTDRDSSPSSTAGALGALRVLSGAGGFTVKLSPSDTNELFGSDNRLREQSGLKAQLSLTMPGSKPLQSRFAIDDAAQMTSHAVPEPKY